MTSFAKRVLRILIVTSTLVNVNAFAQQEKEKTLKQEKAGDLRMGGPYYLATCPISGEKLGGMGESSVKVYDGREVRFCCNQCPSKFEKDLPGNLTKLDQKMADDQRPLYPLKTSLVSGKQLPEKPIEFIYGNRLVRVSDASEKESFMKEPKASLEKLDKAVVADQGKNYPLNSCVVSGEKFGGEMGEPKDVVLAGRLVKLCCNQCKKDLEKSPAEFIAKVDAARGNGRTKGAAEPAHKP